MSYVEHALSYFNHARRHFVLSVALCVHAVFPFLFKKYVETTMISMFLRSLKKMRKKHNLKKITND